LEDKNKEDDEDDTPTFRPTIATAENKKEEEPGTVKDERGDRQLRAVLQRNQPQHSTAQHSPSIQFDLECFGLCD
jgi:hypothetical protein